MKRRDQGDFVGYVVGVISCVVALSGGGWALAQSVPGFQGLGGLGDVPGGVNRSHPWGVSGDGSVVVGVAYSALGREAFRWTQATGMVGLGHLPGGAHLAEGRGVSADGSVVVGVSISASGHEAFRWTEATGMVGLGDLPGGIFWSEAHGVSAGDSVVVGRASPASSPPEAFRTEAFRWTQTGGMVGLGDLPGGFFHSHAIAISADGSVVVGISKSEASHPYSEAFRWTQAGGMVGLGDLPGEGFFSEAFGISADGSVVVGRSDSALGLEAFRWTEATGIVGLGHGDLPGEIFDSTDAKAVSADGSVVVGRGFIGDQAAFIWDPINGVRRLQSVLVNDYGLDLTGWWLLRASGISEDGRVIVGTGENPSGEWEAWIAILPECTADTDCNDGLYCTGVEMCVDYACTSSGNPCQAGETCDEDSDTCVPPRIPTVSAWGLIIMGLLLLTGLKVYFGRRRTTVEARRR